MKIKHAIIAFAIILSGAVFTCQEVNPPLNEPQYSDIKSIPSSYGKLVSVTTMPAYPRWAQLWFQDDSGNITIVRLSFNPKKMLNDVWTITRN